MTSRHAPGHPLHPESLKDKQRTLREGFSMPLTLRVHRALSWLRRAEAEQQDEDVRFVLLWIGFNAAYAGNVGLALAGDSRRERDMFSEFFATLVAFDGKHRIYDMVWQRFSQEIRLLLDNRFVFAPFWNHHNQIEGYDDWNVRLERERVAIGGALRRQDTATILSILFGRMYVLRNQLVHGGATWNSEVNRAQVRDGAALLGCLLPVFIDLMMDNPDHEWAMPHYPVIEENA
ncbi:hypothetical protein SAMN02927924_02679 [Sphingobium faniae]|nr:hypothetical protein SAMN02927924_02679 [Sphingobium faniae]